MSKKRSIRNTNEFKKKQRRIRMAAEKGTYTMSKKEIQGFFGRNVIQTFMQRAVADWTLPPVATR